MSSKDAALNDAIHEVADIVVNWGGYADDPDEANFRAGQRDAVESAIRTAVSSIEAALAVGSTQTNTKERD